MSKKKLGYLYIHIKLEKFVFFYTGMKDSFENSEKIHRNS